jgi:hypothetical protein
MSIDTDRVERLAERAIHLTPGRDSGRMVDGVDLVIDGLPAGRRPPRWIRELHGWGYEAAVHGRLTYVLFIDDEPRQALDDVREALYEALATIGAGYHPDRVRVEARTPTGRSAEVVRGHRVIGMAIGALQDPPITVIEGPSVLPAYAPGERPAKRKRSRRGGSSRG